jgi:hypothetical protein
MSNDDLINNNNSNSTMHFSCQANQTDAVLSDSDVEYRNEKVVETMSPSMLTNLQGQILVLNDIQHTTIDRRNDSTDSLDNLVPPDIGYSSGENSLHEHIHDVMQ